jgi:hypothetical protein
LINGYGGEGVHIIEIAYLTEAIFFIQWCSEVKKGKDADVRAREVSAQLSLVVLAHQAPFSVIRKTVFCRIQSFRFPVRSLVGISVPSEGSLVELPT